jgi:glycosyltransferase involved in cell wall biosynthesis
VREGWGLVVIEAASVGTPAVGYDVAGIRDSIRPDETGLLVANANAAALGSAAARLARDETALAELSRAARERAGSFAWDATADGLAAIVADARGQAPVIVPRLEPVEVS